MLKLKKTLSKCYIQTKHLKLMILKYLCEVKTLSKYLKNQKDLHKLVFKISILTEEAA
jgi:hypothetical protein